MHVSLREEAPTEALRRDGDDAPELFFGIVSPMGVPWREVAASLERSLDLYGYETRTVQLSSFLTPRFEGRQEDERIEHYIGCGNRVCREAGTDEAVVRLAIDDIVKKRQRRIEASESPVLSRTAFVLATLKRPAEVNLLRSLYGPWFLLIAAQAPMADRVINLMARIRASHPAWDEPQVRRKTEDLIALDRLQEGEEFGQNVLHTFPKADLFVDMKESEPLDPQIARFIRLCFGETIAPTDEESGMSAAYLASLRSTSRRRRVGAALMSKTEGRQASLVAVGMNEVAQAGGGHPTNPLAAEQRRAGLDYSRSRIAHIGADFLRILRDQGLLSDETLERAKDSAGLEAVVAELFEGPLKEAELSQLIEFHQEVHGELSAILDAARRGASTQDLTLFTTTYPCHLCGKEIVATGINEVVYIQPYPKSAVEAMYEDSIATDREHEASKINFRWFVGIGPVRFVELFQPERASLREYTEAERKSVIPTIGKELQQNVTLLEREQLIARKKGGEG